MSTLPDTSPPLPIRKLEIDLQRGFGRHWHGGNVFRSQYFNALSMSFPVGEQFFIDSVRNALPLLPDTPENAPLRASAAAFIGQEATHRHIHGLYNTQLEKQGLVNRWQHWAQARVNRLATEWPSLDPRHALAMTCALEHFTALLADGTLRHPEWLAGAEPDVALLWRWHAAEETEHRALAYDLYRAVGGNRRWRVRWYLLAWWHFTIDATRQTVLNLWQDGTLFRPRTWVEALGMFFGRKGVVWHGLRPALAYFGRDFHPSHEIDQPPAAALAQGWLAANAGRFRVIR